MAHSRKQKIKRCLAAGPSIRRPRERREDFLIRVHDAEGQRLFGKRWDTANIGWYTEPTSISSKVYGDPAMVLTTSLRGDAAVHDVTPY